MFFHYLFLFAAGFFLSIVLVKFFKMISLRYNILFLKGISHAGGISMGVSFFLICAVIFFADRGSRQFITAISIPCLAMLFFGIIDDIKEMTVNQKLIVQAIVASLLVFSGIKTKVVYFSEPLNILITFIWIIGITNAFNHLDILDGLAAGTAVIVAGAFFIIGLMTANQAIALLSSALIGIVAGFLVFNLHPAKIYMGNSGSHFLGVILAAVSLQLSYASLERNIALFSPVFIMGFFIFDTVFLIWTRASKGKSPLLKSNDHLALRFLKIGYSKNKTLFCMLVLVFFFTFCGVLLSRFSNFTGLIIIGCVITVSLVISLVMGRIFIDS